MITTMDNQQERLVQAARLAMLIDTDGFVTMRVVRRKRDRMQNLSPDVGITNTNKDLIEWASSTLQFLGIPAYVRWTVPHGIGKLPQGRVTVLGMKRVEKLLPVITPWLIAKKSQATKLAEFITLRLAAPHKAAYSAKELELANEARGLNTKGRGWRPVSSTTTRDAAVEMREHLTA